MTDPNQFPEEVFGCHAQQAVEKSMKAWLASRGAEYPLTHNIGTLLHELQRQGCEVGDFWEFVELTAFAVQFRYEAFEEADQPLNRHSVIAQVRGLYEEVTKQVSKTN